MKVLYNGIVLLLLLSIESMSQCNSLSFEEGYARKLISEDLFNTSLNSEFLGCPQNTTGDSVLCGRVQNTHANYDIGLPDGILFSMFLTPRHYQFCKTFLADPFFQESFSGIPSPKAAAIAWYDKWKYFTTGFLSSDEPPLAYESLDEIQRKMITVLHSINSWTYCPKIKYGAFGTTHATYDEQDNIVIYRTACKTSQVYEANVAEFALVHRLFFVCAHEIAHVIDRKREVLGKETREKSERRANVNGLIITLAFAKLFNEFLRETQEGILKKPNRLQCDEKYISTMIKKWTKIDAYLAAKIKTAKEIYEQNQPAPVAFRRNKEWTLWACTTLNKSNEPHK